MNRTDFIKNLAAGGATLFVAPAILTSCEKEDIEPDVDPNPNPDELSIDLTDGKYASLLDTGGFYIESNVIIINTGAEYIALSSVCTHSGCRVSYNHADGNLPCPCHGSIFSTVGAVVQGPADAPLTKYAVSQEGDVLTIAL